MLYYRFILCTDSQRSMQSIEYNEENNPILNQIYNILAEVQAQDKKITLKNSFTHEN